MIPEKRAVLIKTGKYTYSQNIYSQYFSFMIKSAKTKNSRNQILEFTLYFYLKMNAKN
jgi:hypothetical protein